MRNQSTDRLHLLETIAASATKFEVAERLGLHPSSVHSRCERAGERALSAWRRLPAGGAFAGRDSPFPRPFCDQARVDALIDEAAADHPPDPALPQRENVARLIFAAYAVHGSIDLPRGWVRAVIRVLTDAGCRPPTPAVARWYRSRMAEDPAAFADQCPDPQLLDDMLLTR